MIFPLVVVLGVALFAAWPLLTPGFIPTHDGEYHLIRFYEFDKNIKAGNFFPRWASGLNAGYGVPLFNFFYPLPNYVAEFFHLLGFSFIDSFKLTLAAGLIAGAIFFYLWAAKRWDPAAGGVGAIFYTLAPYHLVDVYVRGSVGEVLALALFPAVLWLAEKRSWWAAGALALLILSHNLLALLFLPFLISYLIFRKFDVRYSLFVLAVSFGLSAYFWLPALLEAKYVVGLKMIDYALHFPAWQQLILPSWEVGFSGPGAIGELSFQIGLPHLIIVLAALVSDRKKYGFWLAWFLLILFMLLPISLLVWQVIPGLDLMQYPWRLLSLNILVTSALAAVLAMKSKWLAIGLVSLALLFYGGYTRPVKYAPRSDGFYLNNPVWTDGTATLGDSFSTIWAPGRQLQRARQKIEIIAGQGEVSGNLVEATTPVRVKVNTLFFPGWQVWADEQRVPAEIVEGLMEFDLPAGKHQVAVDFAKTPIKKLANGISLVSLLFLGRVAMIKKRQKA